MNLFITGTDTNVGKTIVSSLVCLHTGANYWKPIQTGDDLDSETLKNISINTEILSEAYKLKAPLSAYDASLLDNIKIDTNNLIRHFEKNTVIEGAGGCLVPITEKILMADLINLNNAKALLVAKSKLGMINHILMSIEVLRSRNVSILGIIINGDIENNIFNTIEKFGGVEILNVIPHFENLKIDLKKYKISNKIKEYLS